MMMSTLKTDVEFLIKHVPTFLTSFVGGKITSVLFLVLKKQGISGGLCSKRNNNSGFSSSVGYS